MRENNVYSCSIGESPINYIRNRYTNRITYNSNRVVLNSTPNNPDGYINASHIKYPEISTTYIASQGPLPETLEDFWEMICKYKIKVIAMLCKFVESNYPKCEQYWPKSEGESKTFGIFSVTFIKENTFTEFSHRLLKVKSKKYGEIEIQQLHYTQWPDYGCPKNEKNILELIEQMNNLHNSADFLSPILVHCSAGCGRTGTVIALNIIREFMNKKKPIKIDIEQLVTNLRKQRPVMVETEDQFQLLNKCFEVYSQKFLESSSSKQK